MPDDQPIETWSVFPSRHSVVLRGAARGEPDTNEIEDAGNTGGGGKFLQQNDLLLEGSEPPLALSICADELRELMDERLVGVTHYGPEGQDKASNEDFAVSAVIRLKDGSEYSFAALADGVSTRTFWAARTARLACLGAYKATRECLLSGFDPGDNSLHSEFVAKVVNAIGRALAEDSEVLARADAVPSGWDRAIYTKHKADLAAWYRSTLLFGVLGAKGGFIGVTGDGGIRAFLLHDIAQRDPSEVLVLSSEKGRELTSYVSRDFSRRDIQLVPLKAPTRRATHIVLASDGLDITLQTFWPNEKLDNGLRCCSRYRDLPLANPTSALAFLEQLSGARETDSDNLSVARFSWPLSGGAGAWPAWRTDNLTDWRSTAIETLEARGTLPVRDLALAHPSLLPRWLLLGAIGFALGSILTVVSGLVVKPWKVWPSIAGIGDAADTSSADRPAPAPRPEQSCECIQSISYVP